MTMSRQVLWKPLRSVRPILEGHVNGAEFRYFTRKSDGQRREWELRIRRDTGSAYQNHA